MRVPVRNKISIINRHILSILWTLVLAFCATGCGLSSRSAIIYHNLDYPSPPVEYANPSPDTLMVYKFLSAPSVDNLFLTISSGSAEGSIVSQHRWQENPVDMITELVLRDIETSRLFHKAVDQWSSMRYRYALEGTVRKLRGEIINKSAKAVVEADVSLIDFEASRLGKKIIFKKLYKIEEPSVNESPAMIAEAMNRAVRRLSKSIREDVSASILALQSGETETSSK